MPLCSFSEWLTTCDWQGETDDYVTAKLNVCPMGNVHQTPFIPVWDQISHSGENAHVSVLSTLMKTWSSLCKSFRQSSLSKLDANFPYSQREPMKADLSLKPWHILPLCRVAMLDLKNTKPNGSQHLKTMLEAKRSGSVNQTAKISWYISPQVQPLPGHSYLLPWKPSHPHTLLNFPETACLYSAWKISSAAWLSDVPHLVCMETQCSA